MGVIYLRTNLVNGMQYVGQAEDFIKRERAWKCLKWAYANKLLTEERNKYGLENFKVEILEECDDSRLDELERIYIEKYNTIYPDGYNDNEGGTIGFHHSERVKKNISEANSGEKNGMYGKTPWNKGKPWSDEVKKKLSDNHKGNKTALGHVLSEDAKEKISKKKKGVPNLKLSIPVIQVLPNGDIVEYESIADAKRKGYGNVYRVCKGQRPQAYGCKWYYKDEYEKMLGENNP